MKPTKAVSLTYINDKYSDVGGVGLEYQPKRPVDLGFTDFDFEERL